nr:ATP synthase mitochondrial F1 complex assembly factor 1 isoform X2 [Dromaius novaehollandiae]
MADLCQGYLRGTQRNCCLAIVEVSPLPASLSAPDESLGAGISTDLKDTLGCTQITAPSQWMHRKELTVAPPIPLRLHMSKALFLYALPRKEGYEFFVGQWSGTELHFTSLINIQTQGETAPSHLVLYHYPELQKEKGIVLMTAEMDSKFLVVHEAQCLANQVQLFYATDRSETYELVEIFNHRPNEFKYMSVIAELEQSGLGRGLSPSQDSDKS